jgi:hypothetical protein
MTGNYHRPRKLKNAREEERHLSRMRKPVKEIELRSERYCAGGKVHRDAERIAEYAIEHGQEQGSDVLVLWGTHDEFAAKMGFIEEYNGFRRINSGRYRRALNHLRDCVDSDGSPCAGLTTHYKQVKRDSGLWFIDGMRKREHAVNATVGVLRGWAHQEKSQRTERRRMKETLQVFLNSLDANTQGHAYQLTTRVLIKIEEEGVVPDGLMAEFESFLATLTAA